jgi:capsular exopolysaccharide synthesis family protein
MSKYFDQTRSFRERNSREAIAKKLDVSDMLDAFKKADEKTAEMCESRIQNVRKIEIVSSPETMHVLASKEAPHGAMESYRALRTRLTRLQAAKGIRSVVLSSAAPSEGKTLTTLNLALCCAQLADFRVVVIDGDLRSRGLTRLIGDPAAPGLSEVLSGKSQLQDAIQSTNYHNLHILPAGSPGVSPPELFAGSAWKDLIGWCSESFKLVLVDSPPMIPLTDFELIAGGCDAILAVVRAHKTQRDTLQRAASQVDSKKFLGVVYNGAENHSKNGYQNYGYEQTSVSQS